MSNDLRMKREGHLPGQTQINRALWLAFGAALAFGIARLASAGLFVLPFFFVFGGAFGRSAIGQRTRWLMLGALATGAVLVLLAWSS